MGASEKLLDIIHGLLVQLPSLLTMLVCIVLAMVRWRRHPKVSLTLIVGLLLLIVFAVIFQFVYVFVPDWFNTTANATSRATVFLVITFINNCCWAIGLVTLFSAIFMQRNPSRRA